ncbi:gamma-glutamylcyclotransferase family protein [Bosea sp. LjRoot90]|uniref:gamma-glutamylcyclotransferase family protein n=1 Tax=Bosea sp. LjRoot90 TaxID=3342342 RepID=UPI003F50CB19
MPLYFAYGLNMDIAGMAQRCPRSKPLGLARLPRHRFIVTTDGYASVIRDPRESVHGVLWDCALGDIRTLDKFEELASGLYAKISQPVIVEGGAKRALIYVGRSGDIGRPRPGYLESIITSARSWDLPETYLAGMNRFLSKPIQEDKPSTRELSEPLPAGPVAGVRPRAATPNATIRAGKPSG